MTMIYGREILSMKRFFKTLCLILGVALITAGVMTSVTTSMVQSYVTNMFCKTVNAEVSMLAGDSFVMPTAEQLTEAKAQMNEWIAAELTADKLEMLNTNIDYSLSSAWKYMADEGLTVGVTKPIVKITPANVDAASAKANVLMDDLIQNGASPLMTPARLNMLMDLAKIVKVDGTDVFSYLLANIDGAIDGMGRFLIKVNAEGNTYSPFYLNASEAQIQSIVSMAHDSVAVYKFYAFLPTLMMIGIVMIVIGVVLAAVCVVLSLVGGKGAKAPKAPKPPKAPKAPKQPMMPQQPVYPPQDMMPAQQPYEAPAAPDAPVVANDPATNDAPSQSNQWGV